MTSRNLLLLSNSTLHPHGYLQHAKDHICEFLKTKNVSKVTFIPFALRKQDDYAETARKPFVDWGFEFESLHQFEDKVTAVKSAQAVFIGGGNTFQLLKALYDYGLVEVIRDRVLKDGMPYIGSSAGTNVSTFSINTTNDMPIVYPPSFSALRLVPFNINPHYLDPDPNSTHKGETREQRINQYHEIPDVPPVLALREGSILKVVGGQAKLLGDLKARLFIACQAPKEFEPNSDFSFLL